MINKQTKQVYRAALIGGLILATAGGVVRMVAEESNQERKSTSQLERITFEEAKKAVIQKSPNEERIVQKYLDDILSNKSSYMESIEGWDSFKRFVYDPEFKKMYSEFKKRNITPRASNEKYQDSEKGFALAATPLMSIGEKVEVYVLPKLFQIAENQDEVLSALDNEAYHAGFYHQQGIHIPINFEIPSDFELAQIMHELFSFDLQFKGILSGLRKVSNKYIVGSYGGARVLFKELEIIADEEGTERAPRAKAIYNLLLQQPTNQFFVEKSERIKKKLK